MKKLSFLVPLYNEEKQIVLTLETIVDAATKLGIDFEIIVVDDASSDNSYAVAKQLSSHYSMLKVYKNPTNLGFAKTYFKCLEFSNSQRVMYISSDNDIDFENLSILLANIDKATMILQYCQNANDRHWYRFQISKLFTRVQNLLNKKNLSYYNGFNIYPSEGLKQLVITEDSFAFQAEIVSNLIQKYDYLEVGIGCRFNDKNSSALKIKNVFGVARYVLKKCFS